MKTKLITVNGKNNEMVFDKPGRFVVFFPHISGTISCTITAEKVELYMIGLYDMKPGEVFKVRTEQIHVAPHSFSDLYVLSLAREKSSFSFSGLIRIEKKAQQSHAYQKNNNLILSKDAFVDSRPILEILADDVFCTHGSTSGPLSQDQLQYLQMKGIKRNDAINLSIEGFKQQVYDKLKGFGIKDYDTR